MNKKLTEADIHTKFITLAIVGTTGEKWGVMTQLRERFISPRAALLFVARQ
jgi:hypothetical protein